MVDCCEPVALNRSRVTVDNAMDQEHWQRGYLSGAAGAGEWWSLSDDHWQGMANLDCVKTVMNQTGKANSL